MPCIREETGIAARPHETHTEAARDGDDDVGKTLPRMIRVRGAQQLENEERDLERRQKKLRQRLKPGSVIGLSRNWGEQHESRTPSNYDSTGRAVFEYQPIYRLPHDCQETYSLLQGGN